MNKNLYEIFNEIDANISDEKIELNDMEKKRYKKSFRKNINYNKKFKNKLLAIALSLVLILSFSYTKIGKELYARVMDKFHQVGYSSSWLYRYIPDEEKGEANKYIRRIDRIVESNGIKMRIPEIIIDRDNLSISYLFDVSDVLKKDELELKYREYGDNKIISNYQYFLNLEEIININGEEIDYYNSYTEYENIDLEEGIYGMTVKYDFLDLPDDDIVDLEIKIDKIDIVDVKEARDSKNKIIKSIEGNWEVESKVDRKPIINESNIVKLDEKISYKNIDISLEEFVNGPVSKRIKGKMTVDGRDDLDYEDLPEKIFSREVESLNEAIFLYGETDTGVDVLFMLSINEKNTNEIIFKYLESGGQGELKSSIASIKLFEEIDYLKLTPYILKEDTDKNNMHYMILNGYSEDSVEKYYDKAKEFTIYLNK